MDIEYSTFAHYTDAFGLEGILKSKSLWASHYKFLNDPGEYEFGRRLFKKAFDLHKDLLRGMHEPLYNAVMGTDGVGEEDGVFICSFSQRADLLSQWRGYTNGKGFSIQFHGPTLARYLMDDEFKILPLHYVDDEDVSALRAWFESFGKYFPHSNRPSTDLQKQGRLLSEFVLSLKHKGFEEEAEIRAIKTCRMDGQNVKSRASGKGFKPYYDVSISRHHENPSLGKLPISVVRFGPALPVEQRVAVKALLRTYGYDDQVEVMKSGIPYIGD